MYLEDALHVLLAESVLGSPYPSKASDMYLEDVLLVLLAEPVLGPPWPEGVHPLRHGEGVATGGVADVKGVLPHRLQGLGQHGVRRLPLVVPGALVEQGQEPEDGHLPDHRVVRLLHSVQDQATEQGLADVHGIEAP